MHDVAAASRSRRRAPRDVPLCSRHLSSNVQLFPYQLFIISCITLIILKTTSSILKC